MDKRTRTGKDRIARVRDYLVAYVDRVAKQVADPKNLPPRHGLASSSYVVQYTWPVAAAGMFLAELEARGHSRVKKSLKAGAADPDGGAG